MHSLVGFAVFGVDRELLNPYIVLGLANGCALFDKYIIDGIVNGSAYFVRGLGRVSSKSETGLLQNYGAEMFGGVIVVLVIVFFAVGALK